MTKEELKQEAEESFEQYKVTDEDYVVSPYSDDMGEKMLMYNDEYYAEETYLRLYKQGYLAGAEPREKRIAELDCQKNRNKICYSCANATEKCFKNEIGCPCDKYKSYKDENVELKKVCDETQELLDKQIEATYKLDKENAELKEKNLSYKDAVDMQMYTNRANKEIADKQLTKAKFLLKQLVDAFPKSYSDVVKNTLKQAEQFLKETE